MKVLTIGDIHGRDDWKEKISDDYDLIVFLGDYVDSFDKSNVEILHNLKEIIKLKEEDERVVLLLGNHDLQYLFSYRDYGCSGYRPEATFDLGEIFKNNHDKFKAAYQIDNYLWTHAGVSYNWYESELLPVLIESGLDKEEYILADQLNILFEQKKDVLTMVGQSRGGWNKFGGIFWADKSETWFSPLQGYHQIVGHTVIKDIEHRKVKNGSYTYVDTGDNYSKYEIEI